MNYYRRFPADYLADTLELSMIEDGAYNRLLDYYYGKEKALPAAMEAVFTIARARKPTEEKAVTAVLNAHFDLRDDGWHNARADKELGIAVPKIEKLREVARENGKKSNGRPPKTKIGSEKETNAGFPTEPAHEPVLVPEEKQPPTASHHPPQELFPSEANASSGPVVKAGIPSPPTNSSAATNSDTRATWTAYSTAYEERYGVLPIRDVRVNALLAQFTRRVAAKEAPEVAAWYVRSNEQFYVKKKHPVGLLLSDAEKLRTEWATGRHGSETEARMADRTQARGNVFGALIEEFHGPE